MKPWNLRLASAIVLAISTLIGCGAPRIVERERYFKPVIRHVQPLAPSTARPTVAAATAPDPSVRILEGALSDSRRELLEIRLDMMSLRDSLRLATAVARQQQQFTLSLVDKVAALEQQLLLAQRPSPVEVPNPTDPDLTRKEPVPSVRPSTPTTTPTERPKVSFAGEYTEGVALFNRKRYDEAREWFARLLEGGIVEDLADNCEYWVGECDFARGRWTQAVTSFERVLALKGSNKHPDALLMLGRTYEQLRQTARARAAYQRLVREFPSSSAAATARWKLRSLPSAPPDRTGDPIMS